VHLHLSDALVGVFVLVLFYSRVRRAVVLQPVVPLRMWTRSVMFAVVCGLLLGADAPHPTALAADLGGAAAGTALGFLAMRGTVLERRADGCSYRPHPWIGFGLLLLFIGRLVDRLAALYAAGAAAGGGSLSMLLPRFDLGAYSRDVWTVAVYFLLAAYSVAYALLVLRASRRGAPMPERPAAAARPGQAVPPPAGRSRPSPGHP